MPWDPAVAPGPGPGAPLLIVCALGIERFALLRGEARHRAASRPVTATGPASGPVTGPEAGPVVTGPVVAGVSAGSVTVLRTGMGPRNAERAVRAALNQDPLRHAAVLAAGFCGGLAPGMRPGDLVVADETRHGTVAVPCTDPGPLARAVAGAAPGHRVHTGPLTGTDHVVRGPERARLRAAGAIAADMESAAVLLAAVRAGPRPVAAVRVIVDAPEHELVRIGTVRGGISAFRVLRSVLPAFHEWHRSLPLPRR
ncbi:lipoprotein [Streptomyces inusitatus]|uniref:Lipoprotein n=1 Tax=Streptomyces inusitatus TaxID=68221 RepID=A0A918UTK1_9ACTN|nr:1-hydroxy-2-methyl-2-butenyl 4-diphosphate reductase [Streptomyces inusitatus]GGZ34084.1 lipoprotein [Streptomyces inusitatus]